MSINSSRRTLWGIINCTPDSFSDGQKIDHRRLLDRCRRLLLDGATILDIGGESTRPGATQVTAAEELKRILPLLAGLQNFSQKPQISLDTYKSSVAKIGLQKGVTIINDIWGLQGDPNMAKTVSDAQAHVVITYQRPKIYDGKDILEDMKNFIAQSLKIASEAGILPNRIFIDPGIGFHKTFDQNHQILLQLNRILDQFHGFPVLLGISRKAFIGALIKEPEAIKRDLATAILSARLQNHWTANGDRIHWRVHNVALHREIFAIYDSTDQFSHENLLPRT